MQTLAKKYNGRYFPLIIYPSALFSAFVFSLYIAIFSEFDIYLTPFSILIAISALCLSILQFLYEIKPTEFLKYDQEFIYYFQTKNRFKKIAILDITDLKSNEMRRKAKYVYGKLSIFTLSKNYHINNVMHVSEVNDQLNRLIAKHKQ